eukprot:1520571-Rhodomonas_salina.1
MQDRRDREAEYQDSKVEGRKKEGVEEIGKRDWKQGKDSPKGPGIGVGENRDQQQELTGKPAGREQTGRGRRQKERDEQGKAGGTGRGGGQGQQTRTDDRDLTMGQRTPRQRTVDWQRGESETRPGTDSLRANESAGQAEGSAKSGDRTKKGVRDTEDRMERDRSVTSDVWDMEWEIEMEQEGEREESEPEPDTDTTQHAEMGTQDTTQRAEMGTLTRGLAIEEERKREREQDRERERQNVLERDRDRIRLEEERQNMPPPLPRPDAATRRVAGHRTMGTIQQRMMTEAEQLLMERVQRTHTDFKAQHKLQGQTLADQKEELQVADRTRKKKPVDKDSKTLKQLKLDMVNRTKLAGNTSRAETSAPTNCTRDQGQEENITEWGWQ